MREKERMGHTSSAHDPRCLGQREPVHRRNSQGERGHHPHTPARRPASLSPGCCGLALLLPGARAPLTKALRERGEGMGGRAITTMQILTWWLKPPSLPHTLTINGSGLVWAGVG